MFFLIMFDQFILFILENKFENISTRLNRFGVKGMPKREC